MIPLNVFVVGGGKVGRTIIEALVKEGNNITLIDKNEMRVRDISNQFDIMSFVGNGASYRMLVEAGIKDADILIAVTELDELNILCASVASQVSNCNTIARIRTPDYSEEVWYLRDKLGLTMAINPELECAIEISHILSYPAALDVNVFARGEGEFVKFKVGEKSTLCGMSLSDFTKSLNVRMIFTAGERDGEVFIPKGSYKFTCGDILSFVTSRNDVIECLKILGLYHNPLKNCLIIGGGKGGFYLSKILQRAGIGVKIIEKDYKRCEEISAMLPKATVINGDGTDLDILREEGINYYDAVVPYTDIDEVNVMLALYANRLPDTKAITKISRFRFNEVLEDLNLGSVVYPRRITADAILAYTRAKSSAAGGNIETLYHVFDDRVEAIEFVITTDSEITNIPLSKLTLQPNVVIASIFRRGKMIFPTGNDILQVGDSVMIVTTNLGYNNILEILE